MPKSVVFDYPAVSLCCMSASDQGHVDCGRRSGGCHLNYRLDYHNAQVNSSASQGINVILLENICARSPSYWTGDCINFSVLCLPQVRLDAGEKRYCYVHYAFCYKIHSLAPRQCTHPRAPCVWTCHPPQPGVDPVKTRVVLVSYCRRSRTSCRSGCRRPLFPGLLLFPI